LLFRPDFLARCQCG